MECPKMLNVGMSVYIEKWNTRHYAVDSISIPVNSVSQNLHAYFQSLCHQI